jgi:hypothetical protein
MVKTGPKTEFLILRATLNKGPRRRVQWNRAFLLNKSFELVPRLLDKDSGPREIKLWFSLHGIILEGKPMSSLGPLSKVTLRHMLWLEPEVDVRITTAIVSGPG